MKTPEQKSAIDIVKVAIGVIALVFGWLSWSSLKLIAVSEQIATIVSSQQNTHDGLEEYQNKTDKTLKEYGNDISKLSIDGATTKELVKLISYQFHINPAVIESRVIEQSEINKEESPTTAKNEE